MAEKTIAELVHECYWVHDYNCAVTTLHVLSDLFGPGLESQVLDAATGMHGAGGFRAQCGLVEGTLMFLGIHFAVKGKSANDAADICRDFASRFSRRYGSLTCAQLRPGGFNSDDPPHLCEGLSVKCIAFAHNFIMTNTSRQKSNH